MNDHERPSESAGKPLNPSSQEGRGDHWAATDADHVSLNDKAKAGIDYKKYAEWHQRNCRCSKEGT